MDGQRSCVYYFKFFFFRSRGQMSLMLLGGDGHFNTFSVVMLALALGYHALVFIGNSYKFHCYEVCKVLTQTRAHLDTKMCTRLIDLLPTIRLVPNTCAFHQPNCAILKHDVWYYEAWLCSFVQLATDTCSLVQRSRLPASRMFGSGVCPSQSQHDL